MSTPSRTLDRVVVVLRGGLRGRARGRDRRPGPGGPAFVDGDSHVVVLDRVADSPFEARVARSSRPCSTGFVLFRSVEPMSLVAPSHSTSGGDRSRRATDGALAMVVVPTLLFVMPALAGSPGHRRRQPHQNFPLRVLGGQQIARATCRCSTRWRTPARRCSAGSTPARSIR